LAKDQGMLVRLKSDLVRAYLDSWFFRFSGLSRACFSS